MKKMKGTKTLTGQIQSGTYQGSANRIQLFDGKFTTGYRIIEFKIAPITPTFSREAQGKLATEPKSTVTNWHWDDIQELAWTYWGQDKYLNTYTNLRADNLVIEDLYISVYDETGDNITWNYEITLEKYEFPAWTGAGVLVENLSQAGPQ
tara:strand:+ start:973 stop:1422 length:450 start_codon:yes stop_codon:yes gene_type:complete